MHLTPVLVMLFSVVVSYETWMTPLLGHRSGTFTTYGGPALVEANAEVKGYDISWSPTRCGIAVISPIMLGKIIWIRAENGEWVLCYGIDVVQRRHWWDYVIKYGFIADVPREQMIEWGSPNGERGVRGEMYMGLCPPGEGSQAAPHEPTYVIDFHTPDKAFSGYPYPEQQRPIDCDIPHGNYPYLEQYMTLAETPCLRCNAGIELAACWPRQRGSCFTMR